MAKKSNRRRATRSSARAKPAVRKQSSPAKKAAPARHRRKKAAGSARSAPRAPAAAASGSAMNRAEAQKLLDWIHAFTNKMIDTWPADKATFQSAPTDNHLLWTVGHLATTYTWLTGLLTGTMGTGDGGPLPASYNDLFGYKSAPKPGAADYPPLAEVRRHMDAAYGQFVAALRGLTEADLAKPCAMDAMGFASTRLDAVLKGCWHDGWHQGQLSTLRRALGLPGVM